MNDSRPRKIELLAPARDCATAIEALRHGADAIYIGGPSHSARHAAGNGVDDIARAVDFAHRFDARVYVTLNTLIYDNELAAVEKLIAQYYNIGVDALIVQDMSLLRMDIPPIALHASTQCNIDTIEKARFIEQMGFSQIVVPREMSLDEMAEMAKGVDVPLEAFVHGALCVSYSGNCQAGYAAMGRSANRGECPQVCRFKFDLEDARGRVLIRDKHLLSLRDLNRSHSLEQLLDAGISSLKIEGRLKDVAYVKNVTAAYRRRLDEIMERNPDKYMRSSLGTSQLSFTPDLSQSFNRGFTGYFTQADSPSQPMASIDTPKWIGRPIGRVTYCKGTDVGINLEQALDLNNGDGLGYFNRSGQYEGFRVNKAEKNRLQAARKLDLPKGTMLYRNNDYALERMMQGDTAQRLIDVTMRLRPLPWGLALDVSIPGGAGISVTESIDMQPARTPQFQSRAEVLGKSGDTIFRVAEITDDAGDCFIPRSLVARLRRDALYMLAQLIVTNHRYQKRGNENASLPYPVPRLTYHDNVANRLARKFYEDHGATVAEMALEVGDKPIADGTVVMTTRYCLRREMGQCLRQKPHGEAWPQELYLSSGSRRWRIDFDCRRCGMLLSTSPEG